MNPLQVKTGKLQFVLAGLLGIFFVPIGFWSLLSGILNGFKAVPVMVGGMSLMVYGAVFWLVFRGYRKSVKFFTDEGLTRNDGREFSWTQLKRVVHQIRYDPRFGSRKLLWRTEIQFDGGEAAWLIPSKVNNFQEVSEFVNHLPCEHTEVKV